MMTTRRGQQVGASWYPGTAPSTLCPDSLHAAREKLCALRCQSPRTLVWHPRLLLCGGGALLIRRYPPMRAATLAGGVGLGAAVGLTAAACANMAPVTAIGALQIHTHRRTWRPRVPAPPLRC